MKTRDEKWWPALRQQEFPASFSEYLLTKSHILSASEVILNIPCMSFATSIGKIDQRPIKDTSKIASTKVIFEISWLSENKTLVQQ